jgi:hypothetical protein
MTAGLPTPTKTSKPIDKLERNLGPRFKELYDRGARIDRDHDVPYVAGYSKNGRTIYMDRKLPMHLHGVDIRPYLREHELVESILIHAFKYDYHDAHQLATRFERRKVERDGKLTWKEYQAFYAPWIKRDETETIRKPPTDLDLTPYVDEHDAGALKRLRAAGVSP